MMSIESVRVLMHHATGRRTRTPQEYAAEKLSRGVHVLAPYGAGMPQEGRGLLAPRWRRASRDLQPKKVEEDLS